MDFFTLTTLCLALNIYHEAGIDPIEGQMAVALVTINRAQEQKKPICTIVFQPKQFSWTNTIKNKDGSLNHKTTPTGPNWKKAKLIAKEALKGKIKDFTGGATHFYADYAKPPSWSKKMTYCGKWGTHLFYKKGIKTNIISL